MGFMVKIVEAKITEVDGKLVVTDREVLSEGHYMTRRWWRSRVCLHHGLDGHTFKSPVKWNIDDSGHTFTNPPSDRDIEDKAYAVYLLHEESIANECMWVDIFDEDLHFCGKKGKWIAHHAKRALGVLEMMGFTALESDDANPNSSWGLEVDGKTLLSERGLASVFMRKLQYILSLATQYPNAWFVHDEHEYVELFGKCVNLYDDHRYQDGERDSDSYW